MYDPVQFHVLGTQLLDDPKYIEDSRIRTAIGRAYYSAFLVARERAIKDGYQREKNPHQEIADYVNSLDQKTAQKLTTLRRARNLADYDLNKDFSIHSARSYLEISKLLIQKIPTLLTPS